MMKKLLAVTTLGATLFFGGFAQNAEAANVTVLAKQTATIIAKENNISLKDLALLNPEKDLNRLYPGDLLVVSEENPLENMEKVTVTFNVKKGDTLTKYAKTLGLTLNEMKSLNPQLSNNLKVGSEVTISKFANVDNIKLFGNISKLDTKKNTFNFTFENKSYKVSYPEFFEADLKSCSKNNPSLEAMLAITSTGSLKLQSIQ